VYITFLIFISIQVMQEPMYKQQRLNLKLQAPRQKDGGQANHKQITNFNIQHAAQAPALRVTKTVLICSFFDTSSMFGILNFPDKTGFIESLRSNRLARRPLAGLSGLGY